MRHLWCSIFGYMCSMGGRKTLAVWVLPLLHLSDCTLEEPQTPMLLLLQLLSFCPPGLSARGTSWLGSGQPPAAGVQLWLFGSGCGAESTSWAGLSAKSHCQILMAPGVSWLGTDIQEPLHSCVLLPALCAVTCPAPVVEGCRVVARMFFRGTLIFILQVSYLDENKSLTVCVSLQYTISALPSPPSLLPVLWKSGSEPLTARLEPIQIST